MVDQSLMSGDGEVYLRPEDRHVDLDVLIAETIDGQLVLKKGHRAGRSAEPVSGMSAVTPSLRPSGALLSPSGVTRSSPGMTERRAVG
jgi:hypothetical protein